jgi:hypothetical protein
MTDLSPASGTPRPFPRRSLAATAVFLTLAAAACAPAGSHAPTSAPPTDPPSGSPAPVPSPTLVSGSLDHATGAKDVVFRINEGGGFVPVEHNATAAPWFTLYGDGTVVFRDPYAVTPEPINNVTRAVPFQTVKLDESAIQVLLENALGAGGLGVAAGPYSGLGADFPTTTFEINVGGQKKTVEAMGLSPDMHPQNAVIIGQLSRLAEQLRGFADDVAGEQAYVPATYRGVLIPVEQPMGPVVDWPWDDITPDQFVSGDNEFWTTRTMTLDEVNSLGIPDVTGGLLGVSLEHEDKLYTFALRPLLPDEIA